MKAILLQAFALSALAAVASAQVSAGPEFRVNTFTTGRQFFPRAAMARNGDFVIVWESLGQDGNAQGIFGQRFAASGTPLGSEFQVNTYTTYPQVEAALAMGRRGDFVVVWASIPTGSGYDIRGRRYDVSGNPIGGEFAVNTYTYSSQNRPHVGMAADGAFVVSWTSAGGDGSIVGIAARLFDAAGAPVGSEFVVNTYTTGSQISSDVAVGPNGDFVVVWEDFTNDRDGSGSTVLGQRFDAGGNPLGTEFQVNSYTTGPQQLPSVSVSTAGGFVVAFASEDGSGCGAFARRFDSSGNALGADFQANTTTPNCQYGVAGQVAHDARGNFIVTWTGSFQDGSGSGVYGQRFSASGSRRGAEFQVNSYTTGEQAWATVGSDAVGNFVMSWQSSGGQDGSDFGVFSQRFGGLRPGAIGVDVNGNAMLEPGETVGLWATWMNVNGAPQTFGGVLSGITGPPGASYAITDTTASYPTITNGGVVSCLPDCYALSVSDPATRPALHWDVSVVESILPDAHGQQQKWVQHVGRSFTDVPVPEGAGTFYYFIEALLHHGITGGCGATTFCPLASTTREQMAVFVLVGKEGPGYVPPACGPTPMFDDVPATSAYCRWIEELARRGVVTGCQPHTYCPSNVVPREQMPVFVLRTLDPTLNPPACTTPIFNDVPASSPYCRWIEELVHRHLVVGCGAGLYCPGAPLTRQQMAVFIVGTFGLMLSGS